MRVGVIGVGMMGKNHARIYADLEGVELVAVADPEEARAQQIGKKYGTKAYADYQEMLKNEQLALVSVVVPTKMHLDVGKDCFSHGVHVLMEKPIAATPEEGKELVQAAQIVNKKLMIGHIERFNPAIQELKRRLEDGELGKVFLIDVKRMGPFPSRIRDVGVVIDLAVHDVDIISYLTDAKVKRLTAETGSNIHTTHEDMINALLKLENGCTCNLSINWLTPTKVRQLSITGEKGMFVADYLTQDLYFYENDMTANTYYEVLRGVNEGRMIKLKVQKQEPLRAELQHFIDSIKNDAEPSVHGDHGIQALQYAQDLVKSGKEQQVIRYD